VPAENAAPRRTAIARSMMTFVVRLTRDEARHTTAIVEQVKTGRKVRVEGLEAIGHAIAEMIAGSELDEARDTPETGGSP
jgi:hypothetical protein